MVAALVRPTTAPRACRMVPAPMKPTPVTICAAMRVGSAFPPASETDSLVYSTEPMQIRMFVRRPAGLPPSSRSRPIAPPNSVARPTWSISSRRKISTTCLNILEQSHPLAHIRDRALRQRARAVGTAAEPLEHSSGIAFERRRAFAQRRQLFDHVVRQHPFAVEAPPP